MFHCRKQISRPESPGDHARGRLLRGTLIRDEVLSTCIRGTLLIGDQCFHILERLWADNLRNESCIPGGAYTARFVERSPGGRYRDVFWLPDVPGRTAILIHNGNTVDHSRGCLIIGKRRGTLAGKPAVLNSRTALGELAELTGRSDFNLTLLGDQK